MPSVKPLDLITSKWQRVAAASTQSYEEGVKNPRGDYAAGAAAAAPAWASGVQAAVSRNGFAIGVRKAGNTKWQNNTLAKGPTRFGQGVQVAGPDFAAGFAPYRETIQSTQLPARGARRSPQNLQRVNAMVQALSAKKEALLKGGA